jgi:iron complex transport system substrate-binding protein
MRVFARIFALPPATLALAMGIAGVVLAPLPGVAGESARYPLTVRNCGVDVTLAKAPQRVVSIGQASTELLMALGLAERIVGTAVWFGPVAPEFAKVNAGIKRLADNDPSFEAVVGQKPDLVTAQFEWHVGPHGTVGTRDGFAALGIPTYVSPADCVAKDNSGGGDGLRKSPFSMDLVYREIRELAAIFDVRDRGEALVATLARREAEAVRAAAADRPREPEKAPSAVFWFSSKEVAGDAFVAGRNGVPAYIMGKLGLHNIINTDEEWPLVSWERIAAANPSVIVIAAMDRRRYPADDPVVKIRFLETDPVASQLQAVRQKHIVVMNVRDMHASIGAVDGIEALAQGLKQFGLAER